MSVTVRVVGLGPSDANHVTRRSDELIRSASRVRLRTRRHPAASEYADVASYDELYERAESFDELYDAIVEDLVALAHEAAPNEVLYVVPGSPLVAERTVELLRSRPEVTTIVEPAVSVIDVACAVLAVDPMAAGLRVVDALGTGALRGPGPLLILQSYSPAVLALVGDRLPAGTPVTVLHHLGLDDQAVTTLSAERLSTFGAVDHLTSLWVPSVTDAGDAFARLVEVCHRLRRECPWDAEQTHQSLAPHLIEEAYEALDALAKVGEIDGSDDGYAHVAEELGDLLAHVVYHGELGGESGVFTTTTIVEGVREKLVRRHPHVFGDVVVSDANDVARRWEENKREEKGRKSVTDGIVEQLPALTLYQKVLQRAELVGLVALAGEGSKFVVERSGHSTDLSDERAQGPRESPSVADQYAEALCALVARASSVGVDLEGLLRERALALVATVRRHEIDEQNRDG